MKALLLVCKTTPKHGNNPHDMDIIHVLKGQQSRGKQDPACTDP